MSVHLLRFIEMQASKWWKVPQLGKRRHQRSRDVAAYADASGCSQHGPLQADSCQGPAHTAFQGLMFGESRQAEQQVTEELPHAMAHPVQSPIEMPLTKHRLHFSSKQRM